MHIKIGAALLFSFLAWNIHCVISVSHGHYFNRHAYSESLALRGEGGLPLHKRAAGSTWKYYNVETGNAGSCGSKHVNTDFTVAMNVAQMNPDWCFKTIKLTQGGKTTTATISDTCMGCDYGGIDLTEGLFAFFVGYWPTQGGVLIGDWEFTDDTVLSSHSPLPPVTTTKPPPAPPISTFTKHKSVTSSATTPSTIRAASISATANTTGVISSSVFTAASSTSTPSSVEYLSVFSGGLAIPTGSIQSTDESSNLEVLNTVIIQLGGLALVAGRD